MDLGFGACKGGTLACLWTAACWLAMGVSSLMLHSDAPSLAARGCEHVAACLWQTLLTFSSISSLNVLLLVCYSALLRGQELSAQDYCLSNLQAILSRMTADCLQQAGHHLKGLPSPYALSLTLSQTFFTWLPCAQRSALLHS